MAVNVGQRNVADTPGNRALYACDEARRLAIHTIKNGGNQKMKIQRSEMPIIAQKELENLKAENEDQKATIMYLSMMSGIDIIAEQDTAMTKSTAGGENDE